MCTLCCCELPGCSAVLVIFCDILWLVVVAGMFSVTTSTHQGWPASTLGYVAERSLTRCLYYVVSHHKQGYAHTKSSIPAWLPLYVERETERQRETDTERDRHRERDRERHRERETQRERDTHTHTQRERVAVHMLRFVLKFGVFVLAHDLAQNQITHAPTHARGIVRALVAVLKC